MDEIGKLAAALAGRYELDRQIGAGGMATVYLARDLKHNRRVAVKMLRPELGVVLGPERFLTEIQVTANLQHPNLLPLFDSGAADGLLYYVMPYVDGETLRDRIDREKQLPIDEALQIAVAVASALEYAHGHGVIHRDLKPENILMQAGQPIVADFGIALAVSIAGGPRVTQSGMSLGTPQYMSPEQATGDRALDARADIYSLGAVVYEMLTGETPHAAPTAQATIAKLLSEEVRSMVPRRRAVPEHVDDTVLRALEKLPADRFTSARSFADALQGKAHVTRPMSATRDVTRRGGHRPTTVLVGAGLLIAVGGGFVLWKGWPWLGTEPAPTRNALAFQGEAKYSQETGGVRLALSPDGKQLAYVGTGPTNPVYLKRFDEVEPKRLAGVAGIHLQFSPDGQYLAFVGFRGDTPTLFKMQLPGGVPTAIGDSVNGYSWGDGDVIVANRRGSQRNTLWLTRASGGTLEPLAEPDTTIGERAFYLPHLLPGGKAALFNISKQQGAAGLDAIYVAAIRLDDKHIERFGIVGSNPRYVSTGHLLYTLPNGVVMAVEFDHKELTVGNEPPVPVIENVLIRGSGASQYTVSPSGSLVYVNEGAASQLVVTNRFGQELSRIGDSARSPTNARFSNDGARVAFTRGGINAPDVWLHDLATGSTTPLTADGRSFSPEWSDDGTRVSWTDSRNGSTRWRRWDMSDQESILLDSARAVLFSPDGRFLTAVSVSRPGRLGERFFVTRSDMRRREPFVLRGMHLPNLVSISQFEISPDSKWLAFAAIPDGGPTSEVFVQGYPPTGVTYRITVDGGTAPIWGATSEELFYRHRGQLWSAKLRTTSTVSVIQRDSLFAMNVAESSNVPFYDASPDGMKFVMSKFLGERNPPPVHVTNWFVELKARVKAARTR